MTWEGDKLMVGGRCVTTVEADTLNGLGWYTVLWIGAKEYCGLRPTREAAMQAAESAVREWLGKAVAEVMEPVAVGTPGQLCFIMPTLDAATAAMQTGAKLYQLPEPQP